MQEREGKWGGLSFLVDAERADHYFSFEFIQDSFSVILSKFLRGIFAGDSLQDCGEGSDLALVLHSSSRGVEGSLLFFPPG
jgi:hypothetical protein